jgi:DNA-binding response OmpR family regulator
MFAGEEGTPRRQRILVVEDEQLIALALEGVLSDIGFDVIDSVTQVSAALDVIARERIDGAILDVNLGSHRVDPVADVLAARACPFLFMTGYDISELPAGHAGCAVLQKPFRMEQLLMALRTEFGFPADRRCGFDANSRLRGDRHPSAADSSGVPTPGL